MDKKQQPAPTIESARATLEALPLSQQQQILANLGQVPNDEAGGGPPRLPRDWEQQAEAVVSLWEQTRESRCEWTDDAKYWWELEAHISECSHQIDELQSAPARGPADIVAARHEIGKLNDRLMHLRGARSHPAGAISDWNDLSTPLKAAEKMEAPTATDHRPTSTAEWHRQCVLKTIQSLGLDPQALQQAPQGLSGDRATVRARYLSTSRGRGQTEDQAKRSFKHAWQALLDEGRINYR